MKYLERLLKGTRVEWKRLGEVAEVIRGNRLTKRELSEKGTFPVFHGGLIPLGFYNQYNRKANQIMVINTGSIGEVVWSEVDFWSSDGTFVIKINKDIQDKFLYYFLKTKEFYLKSQKREGGVPTIDRSVIANLFIPLPPLKIQQEIVRILDTFTRLITELTAELAARKKQYAYYREKLLTFKEGEVEWKRLGEVAEVIRGNRLTKRELSEKGTFPVFHGGLIPLGFYNQYNRKANQIMVINTGSIGEVVWSEVDFWSSDGTFVIKINKDIQDKFLYYFLKTKEFYLKSQKREGGVPTIDRSVIANLFIPLPPLKIQQEIVRILDKFNTLTTSISEGLPREIELRKKQYEYYREQLLTFPGGTNE